jgi:hypothetical protein
MQRLSQSLHSRTLPVAHRENRGDLSAMQAKISCSYQREILLHENFILRDGIPRGVW